MPSSPAHVRRIWRLTTKICSRYHRVGPRSFHHRLKVRATMSSDLTAPAAAACRAMLHVFIAVTLLSGITGLAAAADEPGNPAYSIAMSIALDGEIIGMPTLVMQSGSAGTATIAGRYSLRTVVLTEDARYGTDPPGDLSLELELLLPVNGRWTRIAAPGLRLFLGNTATVQLDISAQSVPSPTGALYAKTLEIALVAMKSERAFPVQQENICSSPPREGDAVSPEPEARAPAGQPGAMAEDQVCCKAGLCTCCWAGSGGCCYDGINCPSGCCVITP